MQMKPRCVPCLLKRVLFETELVTRDHDIQSRILRQAMAILSEDVGPENSAYLATKVHKAAYHAMGSRDPYRELKEKSNQVALRLLPKARRIIQDSNDPLEAAALCSIIGNSIDFGIEGSVSTPQDLEIFFEKVFSEGLGYNDLPCVKPLLQGHIVFFTDNCGEIIFDTLLCEELKKYGVHLTVVVKGAPVLTDATLEDAQMVHLDKIADQVLTTGGFAVGVDFDLLPPSVLNLFKKANLIMCKGMANYEAFSETTYRPIVYLLRVKCKSIAEDMGLPMHTNAIKLYDDHV